MPDTALSITQLFKTYSNGFTALKGIDLQVEQGDFFALLGPNGAGKSTTIGIISALINKTSGSIKVFGHDINTAASLAKRHIGLVPQEFNFNIFEPVFEIVTNQAGYYGIPRATASNQAEKLLKQLQLWDKRHDQAQRLSGGMKRRLMIARALVHEPQLLILDEPTAGVDIEIRYGMWKFLREINQQGTTIILTTHYLEEAEKMCRNIAIINDGKIIENTSIKSLLGRLNAETFVLDCDQVLTAPPAIDGFTITQVDAKTLEVIVTKNQQINQLFAELSHHQITITSMRNKVNRLEELFMRILNKESSQ